MAKTVTMVLTKPNKREKGKGAQAWDFASMDGEKFTTFDEDLVEAFLKAELAGKEHAYETVESKNPKYAPTVVGIPGVYADPGPGGGNKSKAAQTPGGGSGGPSHEQTALASAALVGAVRSLSTRQTLGLANIYLKWLKTGEIPEDRSTSGGGAAKPPEASRQAPPPAAPPATGSNYDKARNAAMETWPDRPALAEAWVNGLMMGSDKKDLTDDELNLALAELVTMNGTGAAPVQEGATSGTG